MIRAKSFKAMPDIIQPAKAEFAKRKTRLSDRADKRRGKDLNLRCRKTGTTIPKNRRIRPLCHALLEDGSVGPQARLFNGCGENFAK